MAPTRRCRPAPAGGGNTNRKRWNKARAGSEPKTTFARRRANGSPSESSPGATLEALGDAGNHSGDGRRYCGALKSLLFEVSALDPVALAFACVLMTLVGILAALIPASRAARVDPTTALRDEG